MRDFIATVPAGGTWRFIRTPEDFAELLHVHYGLADLAEAVDDLVQYIREEAEETARQDTAKELAIYKSLSQEQVVKLEGLRAELEYRCTLLDDLEQQLAMADRIFHDYGIDFEQEMHRIEQEDLAFGTENA
jgi:hypothetical protein